MMYSSSCKTNHSSLFLFLFPFILSLVVLLSSTTASQSGPCSNMCQGHGSCGAFGICHCDDGFLGADCSLRSCPYGPAWSDVPIQTNVAHQLAECSNRGICNRSTGKCDCQTGIGRLFEGPACERTICPHDCMGRGSCVTLQTLATLQDPGVIRKDMGCRESHICSDPSSNHCESSAPDYSQCQTTYAYNQPWEANMIQGCFCDDGFEGFDCSIRSCPNGDNPQTTTNQLNEVQLITCKATSGTFTLQFMGKTTKPISALATASQLQIALARLATLHSIHHSTTISGLSFVPSDKISVDLRTLDGDISATVCSEAGTQAQITFLDNFGDLSLLLPDGTHLIHSSETPLVTTQKIVAGTKETDVCSNHGMCNYKTGSCKCINGNWTSSDGYNGPGNRGDCGYDGAVPTTSCPNDCSKYGTCSGSPEFKCDCQVGHGGADCSLFTCPDGKSWFSFPT